MHNKEFEIGGHKIGSGHPCFIIAEAGVNHNGDPDIARRLVDAAVNAKADAVKFQTFKAETLVTEEAPKAQYQLETTDTSESQFEMLRRLELSDDMHRELMTYCQDIGILFLSSAFDLESVELLDSLGVAAFKVPSGEITNLPLLKQMAVLGRPIIVSTGMAYLSEVEAAVHTIEEAGNQEFTLLQCVSNYPANPSDVNLSAMATMSAAFGTPVGYSDHTMGSEIPLAAVAMGAAIIEKHLTLDQSLPGPDHRASLEPNEFAEMVRNIRNVEAAMGHGRKEPATSEADTASVARKFLVASEDLPAGTILTKGSIALKRAGSGLEPAMLSHLIGRTTKETIPANSLIKLEHLA